MSLPQSLSNYLHKRLARRQQHIVLGSAGPFIFGKDLGWKKLRVPLAEYRYHTYVCGRSGFGKSKFLLSQLYQLIIQRQGVCLIDPHSDLATDLLTLLALHPNGLTRRPWLADPANANKVIYIDPSRRDCLIPMNVLKGQGSPYAVAQTVIEAFKRTWSKSLATAPQFENVALHCLLLLIEHGLSLVELPQLLLDEAFRRRWLQASQQPEIVAFFQHRFGKWGKEQALRVESILNKVTALTLNDSLRLCLGAPENRLDLRQIMDEGKILIVNLGLCDRETRRLLGSLLTVQLEQAALSRADIPEEQRRPFFATIDEFASFVQSDGSAQVLSEILSEVRKYNVRLSLAHQGIHQLENSSKLVGALDQTQIKVIFGSGTRTGRVIAEEIFSPDPVKQKHVVEDASAQTRTHPIFESLVEQKELFVQAIRQQPKRQVFVLPPDGDQAVALRTLTVPQVAVEPEAIEALKVQLLRGVATPVAQLDAAIRERQRMTGGENSASISHHARDRAVPEW